MGTCESLDFRLPEPGTKTKRHFIPSLIFTVWCRFKLKKIEKGREESKRKCGVAVQCFELPRGSE